MSINRKGSRRITVLGETYLWRVREKWDEEYKAVFNQIVYQLMEKES